MALPERDEEWLLLILLLLLADRSDGFDELEPYLDPLLERLERSFFETSYKGRLPFPPEFIIERIRSGMRRRSLFRTRDRVDSMGEQIYGRIASRLDLMLQDVDRRFSAIELQGNDTKTQVEFLTNSTVNITDRINQLNWNSMLGVPQQEIRAKQFIPVRIYLSNVPGSQKEDIISEISSILRTISFEIDIETPEETGSWWKRLWMQSKDVLTQEEVINKLAKLERAAEAKFIEKPQAEANKDYAIALEKIVKSLDGVDSACVQIGNLLLVKYVTKYGPPKAKVRLIVRTLSALEMREIEKNQVLLKDPRQIIDSLQKICSSHIDDKVPSQDE